MEKEKKNNVVLIIILLLLLLLLGIAIYFIFFAGPDQFDCTTSDEFTCGPATFDAGGFEMQVTNNWKDADIWNAEVTINGIEDKCRITSPTAVKLGPPGVTAGFGHRDERSLGELWEKEEVFLLRISCDYTKSLSSSDQPQVTLQANIASHKGLLNK